MLARLGAMFERTASVRDEADLQEVLEDVARTISDLLGYRAVVVNVYRPAFDDMLTAAAVGSEESLQQLLGTVSPSDTWAPLLADRFRRRDGAYCVPDGEFDWDALGVETYVPDLEPSDDPNAWLPGDALFVPLRDARHQLLGVISVDEPVTGLRPSDDELDALVTISRHAALALRPVVTSGWGLDEPEIEGATLDSLAPLFCEEYEVAGCYLLPAEVAEYRLGLDHFPYRSEMNGRGPHAWSRHWLLVPLVEGERRVGMIWVDDPRDRLIPTRARLQALRLFANQAVAALRTADQTVRLRHEATHDTLTGLPNRRAFRRRMTREIDAGERFALVLCDMDNLKVVNDTHGHEAGDRALQMLAAALRSGLRRSDEAYRLGGDEFGVVLSETSEIDAERVMRRLRDAVWSGVLETGDRIEASFGVAVLQPGDDAVRLVARADEALYSAKRRREESVARALNW